MVKDCKAVRRPERNDVGLFEDWAGGDNSAGALLFERYAGILQRFFSVRAAHAADDLLQATFLACIESRERLRERSSFRSYLLGIARNQLYAFYRRQGVERDKQLFNTTSRYHLGGSPSTVAGRRSQDEILLTALRTLPLQMQVILQLAYWDDLSPAELSEVLEIPINAVHSRLHRAKQRLRQSLETLGEA